MQLKETAKVIATNRIQPKKKPYRFPALSSPLVTHQASDNTSGASSRTSSRLKLLFVFIFLILGNAVFIPMANAACLTTNDYSVCAESAENIVSGETVTLNGSAFAKDLTSWATTYAKAQVKWFKWEQVNGPTVVLRDVLNASVDNPDGFLDWDDDDAGDRYDGDRKVYTTATYTVPVVSLGGSALTFKLTARLDIKGITTDINKSVTVTHTILGVGNTSQKNVCTETGGSANGYAVCANSVLDIESGENVTLDGYGYYRGSAYKKKKGRVKWFKWEQVGGSPVVFRDVVNANVDNPKGYADVNDDDAGDSYDNNGKVSTSAVYTADVLAEDTTLTFKLTARFDIGGGKTDFNKDVTVTHIIRGTGNARDAECTKAKGYFGYMVCVIKVGDIVSGEKGTLNGTASYTNMYDDDKGRVKWFKWEQLEGPTVEFRDVVNANVDNYDDEDARDSYGGNGTVSTSVVYTVPNVPSVRDGLVFRLTARFDIGGGKTDFNKSVTVTQNVVYNPSDPVITVQ